MVDYLRAEQAAATPLCGLSRDVGVPTYQVIYHEISPSLIEGFFYYYTFPAVKQQAIHSIPFKISRIR